MKPLQDAFGRSLLDFHEGGDAELIVERDDGYIETESGPRVYFTPYGEWYPSERKAIRLARGRVLDVGCGAGRHALYLQDQGRDVLGIDVSPLAARVCRRRGLRHVKCMSISDIGPSLGMFDTILMMGNNFGLFGNPKRAATLLRRFHRMTSSGGRILAECLDPYGTDDPVHRAYHRLNRSRGRMAGQIRMRLRYRNLATPWFDYLFVSPREMRGLLKGTGWRLAKTFGFGPTYVAVMEKS